MKASIRVICLLLCLSLINPINRTSISAEETSVSILSELGLISNTKSNELYSHLNRLVGITMILKAMGYTDIDAGKVSDNTIFHDLKGDYTWGIGWVNIGVENNITTGTSQHTFSPNYTLTKKEFVSFTLRLLGYGIKESYEECDTLAIVSGLIKTKAELTDSYFTKKEAMDVLLSALSAPLKDEGNKTLIEAMIEDGIVDKKAAVEREIVSANELLVSSIMPLSNTYIQINLAEATEFVSPNDFKLVDYYDEKIEIDSAKLYNYGRTVIIETEEQEEEVLHTLTIKRTEYTYEALPDEDIKPRLIDVDVLSNTSIRLIFNETMSEKAIDKDYYSIDNLKVKSAEYELVKIEADDEDDDEDLDDEWEEEDEDILEDEVEYELIMSSIILTTSTQKDNKSYRIKVDSVTDLSYNKINTSYDDEYFRGDDTEDLELERADTISSTRIRLTFSEDLDEDTAEEEDNYKIAGLTIKKATLDPDYPYRVYLTTSEQKEDYKYKVEVSNVESIHGDPIDSSHDSDTFYGEEKDDDGPRLMDVTSLSNTKVEVEFNEPLEETTALMEHAYYFGEELGYALKVEQDEDEEDGTVWIITTKSQLDQEYTLTVRGLKDLEDNFIDEDYAQDSFFGTPSD